MSEEQSKLVLRLDGKETELAFKKIEMRGHWQGKALNSTGEAAEVYGVCMGLEVEYERESRRVSEKLFLFLNVNVGDDRDFYALVRYSGTPSYDCAWHYDEKALRPILAFLAASKTLRLRLTLKPKPHRGIFRAIRKGEEYELTVTDNYS